MVLFAVLLLFAHTDVWQPMRYFVGAWTGTTNGQPGSGTASRTYEFVLRDRFLQVRHKSEYQFIETFELAGPGKDFELYSETRFRRNK